MSGHSKWSTIKRQKGAADAKRSSTFTKLSGALSIAAREGGGDAQSNFKLRLAVEKAREANMPKDNIERAIKRGTGELGGATLEQVSYEAYGPGGVAIIIDVVTDNRNRSVAAIKNILTKYNAKLAENGAVRYLFVQRGILLVKGNPRDALELAIVDSGAEDYESIESGYIVYTHPKAVAAIAKQLSDAGYSVSDVEVSLEPITTVTVADSGSAQSVARLLDSLEELDDVASVATNFTSVY